MFYNKITPPRSILNNLILRISPYFIDFKSNILFFINNKMLYFGVWYYDKKNYKKI